MTPKTQIPKPKGRIKYEVLEKKVNIVTLAADFYILTTMRQKADEEAAKGQVFLKRIRKFAGILKEEHDQETQKLAKLLLAYLVFAVSAELQNKDEIKAPEKKVKTIGGEILADLPDDEEGLLKYLKNNIASCEKALQFFEAAKRMFAKLNWENGFGGKKWADITNTAIKYLQGQEHQVIFIDNIFNIEHHNGHIFDKHEHVHCDGLKLNAVLNKKRDLELGQMLDYFEEKKYASGYLRQLFDAGVRVGWWKK